MGGQTALNCALSLKKMGTLEKFDVEMIGATAEAIDKAEDRELFRDAMTKIGLDTPRSHQIKTLAGALEALVDIGLPAIIRPSFTMGGTGGGIAYNKAEFIEIVERGIDTLLVVGGATSNCVQASVFDASSCNFRVAVVQEAVFDRVPISHAIALFDMDRQFADVIPLADALRHLASQAR